LLILLFAAALLADSITVVETMPPGMKIANFTYNYDVSSFPSPTGASVQGTFFNCIGFGGTLPCGLEGSVDVTVDLYTSGPIRDGFSIQAVRDF